MGRGTIAYKAAPQRKLLYKSDGQFYLRPIFKTVNKGKEEYVFALRPSETHGYLLELEGEFGMGNSERVEYDISKGEYANTKYVYYKEDLPKMTLKQKQVILKWAIDGALI